MVMVMVMVMIMVIFMVMVIIMVIVIVIVIVIAIRMSSIPHAIGTTGVISCLCHGRFDTRARSSCSLFVHRRNSVNSTLLCLSLLFDDT